MTEAWITVGALAVATLVIKASGPVALGGRELPPRVMSVIALLAAALLAALVIVETFGGPDRSLELDARVIGVGAAGLVIWLRGGMLAAVSAAAVAAALARALA